MLNGTLTKMGTGVRLLAAGLLAVAVVGGPGLSQAEAAEVRHGLQRGAMAALRTTLPMVEGEHGIRYDQLTFNDSTSVILALDQGELHVGNLTAQHIVRAIDEGMDLVTVVGWGGGYMVLVARDQIDIARDDVEAFRSMVAARKAAGNRVKMAASTGSQQHMHMVAFLREIGVDPDQDVDIVNIPMPAQVRALDAGEVDFAMSIAPFAAMAIDAGIAKVFHHLYGGERGQWEIGFAVTRRLIEENPDLVQKIVSSHVEAIGKFMDDVEKQVEFEVAEGSFPESIVRIVHPDLLRYTYRIDVADIERTAQMMYEMGWTSRDVSGEVADFIDFSFLEAATGESVEQLSRF